MSTILLVDDEVVIAMDLEEHLTSLGYEVVGKAANGEDGILKAKELNPNLVLMDIMMPGRTDGIEAAKVIHDELEIPVIFVTSYTDDGIIEKAKLANPYGYIVKPWNEREIKAAIEIALFRKSTEKKIKVPDEFDDTKDMLDEPVMEREGDEDLPLIPGGEAILLNNFFSDIILILYTKHARLSPVFRHAIEYGIKNKKRCLFAYHKSTLKKYFLPEIGRKELFLYRMKNEKILSLTKTLDQCIETAPKTADSVPFWFLFDFSEISDSEQILVIKRHILAKRLLIPSLSGILAINCENLNQDILKDLSEEISKVIVSTDKASTISFANQMYPVESLAVVPQALVSIIVRKSLEPLVMLFLNKPVSGFDIVHEIKNRYNVQVPQARIYTILYDFQKKGFLEMKLSGKSKLYCPTERGKEHFRQNLREFRLTFRHIFGDG